MRRNCWRSPSSMLSPTATRNPLAAHASAGVPGTVAAIAADFLESDEFSDLKPSTQDDYRLCLAALAEKFGQRQWSTISAKDPMRMPTAWLTMRTLRHTCITALHDAGCTREQIRAITGHTIASINEVLDRYTKLTAEQAGAALSKRLSHENGAGQNGIVRFADVSRDGSKR